MKLLFAIKSLALGGGGAERVLTQVASEFARRGHSVRIATFDAAGYQSFYPVADAVELCGLAIGDIKAATGLSELARRTLALRQQLREFRPDALIAFMHSSYVPACAAAVGLRVPVIGSEHIVYDHYADRPVERFLLNLSARKMQAVTAVSEQMKRSFPAAVGRKMHVIANPVLPAGKARSDVAASRTILSVGRLEKQKDHKTLIAAFAELADRFSDWRLRIIGDGTLRTDLAEQIARSGVSDRIDLVPSTARISDEYAAAAIFAIPSVYESFGLVTAEALGHGVPAIGFADCAGTNEIIQDGTNGLLVSCSGRVESLRGGLERLMESADLRIRLGSQAPDSIQQYSPEVVVDSWTDLIRDVVPDRSQLLSDQR